MKNWLKSVGWIGVWLFVFLGCHDVPKIDNSDSNPAPLPLASNAEATVSPDTDGISKQNIPLEDNPYLDCPTLQGKRVRFMAKVMSYAAVKDSEVVEPQFKKKAAVKVKLIEPKEFEGRDVTFYVPNTKAFFWNRIGKSFFAELV